MANKKQKKNELVNKPGFQNVTLREESTGKIQIDVTSILRMEHLQNLAVWAGGDEASIPCLAALFGNRLAANAEASGVPLDRSLFTCHKCETILQPGGNCTIRIEKNTRRRKRGKKSRIPTQNNVVYTCHFCLHRNVMMGTVKGHVKKELLASRSRLDSKSEFLGSVISKCNFKETVDPEKGISLKASEASCPGPVTPGCLLKGRKQKMDESSKAASGGGRSSTSGDVARGTGGGGSSKRKRKGWSSLKQIVESDEHEKKITISNLVIPFKL